MGELFIRLNNKFVSKKDGDYYDTTITKIFKTDESLEIIDDKISIILLGSPST